MELATGTVLLGKYRVDEVLGVGGMGRVIRASHLYLQQSVAIKILLPSMAESASTVSRFLREAQATVNLKSEHIARVIDVGTMPDGTPFMVMEYLDGNDLNQILRHHGPQTPSIVCDLMLQACEGLGEAHAMGIVHRDIKPSNFFITKRADNSMLLKILDFGISKTPVNITELTGTQTILGTPTYMAPEQMKSGRGSEPRSDIWSMGVVMYQLLSGRPPFEGETYAELVLKVNGEPPAPIHIRLPPGLGDVILRCLQKDPNHRPQNVGELARSLAPFATDPVSAAQSATRTTRILQHRMSLKGVQGLPLAASGGLSTPAPISPAQLTPRSWPPSHTSISRGAGQVTHQVRPGRGWMIAGVSALVILAGVGGFVVNEVFEDEPPRAAASEVEAPPAPAPPPAALAEPAVTSPPPPITLPPPIVVTSPTIAAKPDAAKPVAAKPTAAKADPAKPAATMFKFAPKQPVAKPVAKVEPRPVAKVEPRPVAKVEPKPKPRPKKKKPRTDDLFDTRK